AIEVGSVTVRPSVTPAHRLLLPDAHARPRRADPAGAPPRAARAPGRHRPPVRGQPLPPGVPGGAVPALRRRDGGAPGDEGADGGGRGLARDAGAGRGPAHDAAGDVPRPLRAASASVELRPSATASTSATGEGPTGTHSCRFMS